MHSNTFSHATKPLDVAPARAVHLEKSGAVEATSKDSAAGDQSAVGRHPGAHAMIYPWTAAEDETLRRRIARDDVRVIAAKRLSQGVFDFGAQP